ncbi:MAG TPA: shikimate dehydrogenase [Vicinamibacterales bacterium]|nr:shikimate dehydrogenase [Vicinamibacterales bacterium]
MTGKTPDAIRRARDEASDADLVEVRLDSMERPEAAAALAGRSRPVIVTCRPAWEGGGFDGAEEDRLRILREARTLGAEFVDIESRAAGAFLQEGDARGVVVSMHDFDGVPADLAARVRAMRSTGADVVKVAVRARGLSDLLPLLAIGGGHEGSGTVAIGMGPAGLPSRVLAARFGSRWTYAGDAVAPGQIPAAHLLHEYRFRRIRPDTAVYGVLGHPVTHSRSPYMHNAGFAALGLNAAYVPLEASDVADFRRFADAIDLRGASVTAPFKIDAMELLDEVLPMAAAVGAVNTIVVRDGRWIGTNTDVDGFLAPLQERMSVNGLRATILGAGGAARAVALALVQDGAVVTVAARRREAADALARREGVRAGVWPPPPGSWDILVNATPAGSVAAPDAMLPIAAVDGRLVYDLVYEPPVTPLLAAARRAGCQTIGGLEMLVAQAERQFELWTGQPPARGLFAAAVARAPSAEGADALPDAAAGPRSRGEHV